jgi:glycosyltransferase involved in cell wall biosynthesis
MSTRFVQGKKILNLIHLIKFNYENNKLPIFLSIIGKGVDYKKISRYIKELKLSKYISLNTLNSEKELNIWNNNLSVYIHFSTGETLSTSIIRALRSANPIIVSNTSGLKEMIGTKFYRNGYLVDDNNYYRILKLLEKLKKNKKLYNKFSQNSLRLYRKNYSLDNSFKKYQKIINFYK